MSLTHIVYIQPLVALIFGILVLMMPRLLNYLVAIYLILVGAMGLWPHFITQTAEQLPHLLKLAAGS
jgi:hypothetical protein